MTVFDNLELLFHSKWWEDKINIEKDKNIKKLSKVRYQYTHPLLKEYPINKDVVLTLRGPRQIGKTTLVKQIIKKLLENNINPYNILFYPCDRKLEFIEIYNLIKDYVEQLRTINTDRIYIFLDEISYIPKWQRGIKSLADDGLLENVTLLLTGSNAIDLKKSSERLPGRTGEYFMPEKGYMPLSFKEFYHLVTDESSFSSLKINQYKKYFYDYLITGGFPAVINEYYEKGYIDPLVYETYTKWIEGDIYRENRMPEAMYQIVDCIDKNLSSRISYSNLAQDSGVASQQTIQEYINILNLSFVTYKAEFYSIPEKKLDYKKNKKLYFIDPFIHSALISKARGYHDDPFLYTKERYKNKGYLDRLVEQMVGYNLLNRYKTIYYFAGKNDIELDFVIKNKEELSIYEVKNSSDIPIKKYIDLKEAMKIKYDISILNPDREESGNGVNIINMFRFLLEEV